MLGTGADTHSSQELPDLEIVAGVDVIGGEDVRKDGLGEVEETVVELSPLCPVFIRDLSTCLLLDEEGARDEHGEHGNTNLGANDSLHVYSVEDKANKTANNVERSIANVGKQSRNDSLAEKLDFITDGTRQLRFVRVRVCQANNIEDVEVDDEDGQNGQTLLVVDVAEDAGNGLLALGVRQDGNERVRT